MAQAAARDEGGGPGAGSAKSAAADAEDAARGRVFAQHGPGGGGCDGREFWRRPNEADGGHSEICECMVIYSFALLPRCIFLLLPPPTPFLPKGEECSISSSFIKPPPHVRPVLCVHRSLRIIYLQADKHHFDECVGKTIEVCQALVDAYVKSHPVQFDGRSTLYLDIRKIRELTDDSYYKVVLRTNVPGTRVTGLFDDGMVYYPWKWRVNGNDVAIGPWNCKSSSGGTQFLSPVDCCAKIQGDVTQMDDAGNYLACFVEEPVGGPNNPERDDRAIVVTDATGKVARAPVAH